MRFGSYKYIPCNVGDTVWVIRKRAGKKTLAQKIVRKISFIGNKMELCIVVGYIRGKWGENIFSSIEDAKKVLEDPHYVSAAQVRSMTLDEVRERKDDILLSLEKW